MCFSLLMLEVNACTTKGLSFHVVTVHLYSCLVSLDVFLLLVGPGYIFLAVLFLVWIVTLSVCRKRDFCFLVLHSLSSWVWFGDKLSFSSLFFLSFKHTNFKNTFFFFFKFCLILGFVTEFPRFYFREGL